MRGKPAKVGVPGSVHGSRSFQSWPLGTAQIPSTPDRMLAIITGKVEFVSGSGACSGSGQNVGYTWKKAVPTPCGLAVSDEIFGGDGTTNTAFEANGNENVPPGTLVEVVEAYNSDILGREYYFWSDLVSGSGTGSGYEDCIEPITFIEDLSFCPASGSASGDPEILTVQKATWCFDTSPPTLLRRWCEGVGCGVLSCGESIGDDCLLDACQGNIASAIYEVTIAGVINGTCNTAPDCTSDRVNRTHRLVFQSGECVGSCCWAVDYTGFCGDNSTPIRWLLQRFIGNYWRLTVILPMSGQSIWWENIADDGNCLGGPWTLDRGPYTEGGLCENWPLTVVLSKV